MVGKRERVITPPFPPSSPTPSARPATHAQARALKSLLISKITYNYIVSGNKNLFK